jgi:hypothetical protein
VTPEWLLTGYGYRKARRPIVGYVGPDLHVYPYMAAGELLKTVEVPPVLATKSTVGILIRGRSMGFHFNNWVMLYDDERLPVTPELIGELCAVGLENGRIMIKQLEEGTVEGRFDLISLTGPAMHDVPIVWAVRIKAMFQP